MLSTLNYAINQIIILYSLLCLVYIFMSWFPNARESSFGQIVAKLVEPYLAPFRQIIPPIGMLDISPIVAILVLRFSTNGVNFIFSLLQ
ncbi:MULTISPECIES: YggT family protein [Bacillaceae]|uniref:YggT family protein n=1 Tax=Evansella alkalicola TaxID=745819 RepID=A0ABS6JQ85_9BACI|nr:MULTISPECIES: YggT family protein [Bacillaceae]MBU9720427.1 YggT family protein [Bacillus alkalicola]